MNLQQSMLFCINAGNLCQRLSITAATRVQYFLKIEIEIERDSVEI